MIWHTPEHAVDHALHRKHAAPRRRGTVLHENNRQFMAEDYGITVEQADEIRAVMIEIAAEAHADSGRTARALPVDFLHRLEKVNEQVDSYLLFRLIESFRTEIESKRR